MIKGCMILENEWLLANCYGPGLGVGLGTTSMNYKDRYTVSDSDIWVGLGFDSDLTR
jgi:hypothetical protein